MSRTTTYGGYQMIAKTWVAGMEVGTLLNTGTGVSTIPEELVVGVPNKLGNSVLSQTIRVTQCSSLRGSRPPRESTV